ncbi:MAG: spore germination protein GerPC [Bacillus sp. (in: firmicutes)]
MYQDYSQYLQWLQMCIQAQEQRIITLETNLNKMKEDIKKLNERKSIHVDKIEYKFDQLKVETLEGTLNIGLNPSDLSGIEDFAVQNQSLTTPLPPKDQMQRSMKIEESIYSYLETDLPQLVEAAQRELAVQPNEEYLAFIKQDIIKQLPSRIEHHLRSNSAAKRSSKEANFEEVIIEALKQEIQNGVFVFFNNLPENVKGMKTE